MRLCCRLSVCLLLSSVVCAAYAYGLLGRSEAAQRSLLVTSVSPQAASDQQTWTITHTLKHESGVTVVAMSPSGREVAAGGILSAGISIWDVEKGTPIRQLTGLKGGVQALAYSLDGRMFATGHNMIKSTDTSVYVFQAGTDTMLQRLDPPESLLATHPRGLGP